MVIIYWLTFIITKEPLISYADQIHTDNTEEKKKKKSMNKWLTEDFLRIKG